MPGLAEYLSDDSLSFSFFLQFPLRCAIIEYGIIGASSAFLLFIQKTR